MKKLSFYLVMLTVIAAVAASAYVSLKSPMWWLLTIYVGCIAFAWWDAGKDVR